MTVHAHRHRLVVLTGLVWMLGDSVAAQPAVTPPNSLQEGTTAAAEREAFLDLARTAEQVLVLVEDLRRKNATLTTRVAELTDLLDIERQTTTELRLAQQQLSALLGDADKAGSETSRRLASMEDEAGRLARRVKEFEDRAQIVQREIGLRDRSLLEIESARLAAEDRVTAERRIAAAAQSQIEILNGQIGALRRQIADIDAALKLSKSMETESQVTIAELGRRLNAALAQKVEELARYRSEFFGRLRESLGDRQDMRVVGDRFVFQSEVLFAPGSAELGESARRQLDALARALSDIAGKIPPDLEWILRVDGHTDTVPIRSREFPSNWELSTARALAVTKYLIGQGVPPVRVAAAGFGEYHPLDPRADEIGFRRNRRIEFKLTEQ